MYYRREFRFQLRIFFSKICNISECGTLSDTLFFAFSFIKLHYCPGKKGIKSLYSLLFKGYS
jgi:hypothetical protein